MNEKSEKRKHFINSRVTTLGIVYLTRGYLLECLVTSGCWYLHKLFVFVSVDPLKLSIGLNPATKKMKTRSSSSSASVPARNSRESKLQIVDPAPSRRKSLHGLSRPRPSSRRSKGRADDSDRRSYASKGFRLPKGWTAEECPRRNSYHIDRFYVERKTGKRFRSLVSVERYLNESGKRNDYQHQQQLVLLQQQHNRVPSKDFNLPDGWIVEEKPRKNSGRIDRFYIEPGTGKKFRSLPAVETYLNGGTVDSGQILANPDGTGFESVDIDPNPPEKVKWVLTGPVGSMFSAHVSGSDVSSSLQKTWSEAFVSLIQERV